MIKSLQTFWLICALSLIIWGCQAEPAFQYEEVSDEIPDQEARNITIINSNGDLLEYQMKAKYIRIFEEKNYTYADTAEIISYDRFGEIETVLTCDQAELDETKNIFIGKGNVVVTSENAILETEYLRWNRNTDQFEAKEGVKIIRENNIMRGQEMRSDAAMSKIEITRVSAEGKLSEEDIDW
jgi:LPS export ABC transporter protein LptC